MSIYLRALKIAFSFASVPLGLIFSKEVTVDKFRNDYIINIWIYLAVNKIRIQFEA